MLLLRAHHVAGREALFSRADGVLAAIMMTSHKSDKLLLCCAHSQLKSPKKLEKLQAISFFFTGEPLTSLPPLIYLLLETYKSIMKHWNQGYEGPHATYKSSLCVFLVHFFFNFFETCVCFPQAWQRLQCTT
jgi:hypothetical protein